MVLVLKYDLEFVLSMITALLGASSLVVLMILFFIVI
jgi:hypothetical protein